MATTLADIASYTGLSSATVSRVLNGKPGVSPGSKQAVLDAVTELGMPPQRIQRNGSGLVGIITPDLSNPIFPEFVTRLGTMLAQDGYLSIVCSYTPAGTSEERFLSLLADQPLAGAIFLGGRYDTRDASLAPYRTLEGHRLPMAFINGAMRTMNGLYTGTDDDAAMTMALRHLQDLGHTEIGLLMGDRNHYPGIVKHEAAQRFFAQAGIAHDPALTAWTTYGVASGQLAARPLLERGATAIVCASDQLAIGAVHAAEQMGLDVPGDVSVTGYDDSPVAALLTPSLTTIRQPVERICQFAVNGLGAMLRDRSVIARRDELLFKPELIVRGSTGRCRPR